MSRVFITGSNGNLGLLLSAIAVKLNLDFILLDRLWIDDPINFVNFASTNFSPGDLLLHFGWETKDKSRNAQRRCFVATEQLAVTCRNHKVDLIFPSTYYASKSSGSHYAQSKYFSEIAVKKNHGTVLRLGLIMSPEVANLHPLVRLLDCLPFFVSFKKDDGVVYVTEKSQIADYFETQLKVWQADPSIAFRERPLEKRKTLLSLQKELYILRNNAENGYDKKILTIDPRLAVRVSRSINKVHFKKLNSFLDPILNILANFE
jgi:hypothetical protein